MVANFFVVLIDWVKMLYVYFLPIFRPLAYESVSTNEAPLSVAMKSVKICRLKTF